MDTVTLADKVLKSIRADKEAIERALAHGNMGDWDKYNFTTGQYHALCAIEGYIRDANKHSNN